MTINAVVNNRALSTNTSIEQELLLLQHHKNYLFDLSYLTAIELNGALAAPFLQGQLTCDMNQLSAHHIKQGALCNLKGRILCLMDVILWNHIYLLMPQDLAEATCNTLSKTAVLSKVTLQEKSHIKIFGFLLQNPDDLRPYHGGYPESPFGLTYSPDLCCYHLGCGFFIFMVNSLCHPEFSSQFLKQQQLLGSLTWHALRLSHKQLDIYPNSRGLFLPHRLDLQDTHYLSFNKGCYKGQEIIARTHYRATLKHELNIYKIKTREPLYSGQKAFRVDNPAEYGELIDYAPLGHGEYFIALSHLKDEVTKVQLEHHQEVIQLAAATSMHLHLH
jgi:tRNA-modifying protein YgfZ